MAHFAKCNYETLEVEQVIVVDDKNCAGGEFPDSELAGQKFIKHKLKLPGLWLQTSYNNRFRHNFAGVGMYFDQHARGFVSAQPYPSWTLDIESGEWVAPQPYPDDGNSYSWDEETQQWESVDYEGT